MFFTVAHPNAIPNGLITSPSLVTTTRAIGPCPELNAVVMSSMMNADWNLLNQPITTSANSSCDESSGICGIAPA